MRIQKLSTLTLAGLFTLSLGACDSGVATEPDENKEAQADDDAQADGDVDADAEAKPIAGPGDAARALVEKEGDFCAFAVGECLARSKNCETSGGDTCSETFTQCRDEHVASHCELGEKVAAGLKAAVTCWGSFGGCSTNGSGDCLGELKACLAKEMGCDGDGCGEKDQGISWPTDALANWPVSQVETVEEVSEYRRYRPGYYRDRYGRIWYLSANGRWHLVSRGNNQRRPRQRPRRRRRPGGGGGWPGGGGGG